jgi:histidinol-phosphatase
MSPFLKTAIEAAEAAQKVIKKYYAGKFEIEIKPDETPVTIADIETEKTIKKIILDAFPNHGFYGEETGKVNQNAEYNWLIDPIDGTKSFVRGYPFFSTQIALMRNGELILGVSNSPEFNEMAYAEKGNGAWLNGNEISVSDIKTIKQSTLSMGNLSSIAQKPQWQNLGKLVSSVNRVRGYGDFYHYHLLASGKIDIVLESDVNILDIAALAVIVREAGGIFTDLEGNELTLDTTTVLASSSENLHAKVLSDISYS